MFSLGQMIMSPVLGLWSNKTKKCAPSIVFGLFLIIIGNIVYCCLEAFPRTTVKWAMLFIRFIVGAGAGVQTCRLLEKTYHIFFHLQEMFLC